MRKPKSTSLLPALPGIGKKAIPLQGRALSNPGPAVLSNHNVTSPGMLWSNLLLQRKMLMPFHSIGGLIPQLARTSLQGISTRKESHSNQKPLLLIPGEASLGEQH